MNDYTSLRKQNRSHLLPLAVLFLCVALSCTLLFSRLSAYAPAQSQRIIPLTKSNGLTSVTGGYRGEDGVIRFEKPSLSIPARPSLAAMPLAGIAAKVLDNPSFQITDENAVWVGQTDMEIFRLSYENSTGDITVNSSGADKVLAPGTGNTYCFTLRKTGNVPLDYQLTLEAYFSDGEKKIPVSVSLMDHQGNYLVGSKEEMVDVLALNEVDLIGQLTAGYDAPYTLNWQWPFDGDDEYDTLLGNMAVDEDLSLTIAIKTVAQYIPGGGGGVPPQTGDTTDLVLPVILLLVSLAGVLLLLLLRKRKGDSDE